MERTSRCKEFKWIWCLSPSLLRKGFQPTIWFGCMIVTESLTRKFVKIVMMKSRSILRNGNMIISMQVNI